ncbi:hypothetical protein J7L87_05345, partial [bacterium]|nr:hypothetical protein [bacterium]
MKSYLRVFLLSFILFPYILVSGEKVFIRNFKFSLSVSTIQIPVEISTTKFFSGFQFTIRYNSEILRFLNVEPGPLISDFNILTNPKRKGEIKIAGFDPKLEGVSGSGYLLILNFKPEKAGVSSITLSSIKFSDKNGKNISISFIPGEVKIEEEKYEEKDGTKEKEEEKRRKVISFHKIIQEKDKKTEKKIIQTDENFYTPSSIQYERREVKKLSYGRKQPSLQRKSDNCVLLVISEYGNPEPPVGISTFKKGENVKCKVEKEIILNEMEKVICTGYKGSGSIKEGKGNEIEFKITEDSKLT